MTDGETKAVHVAISATDQALHSAPVLVVDGAQGFAITNGTVRFNLVQDRLVAGPGMPEQEVVARTVCARLVMPIEVADALANWLSTTLPEVKKAAGLLEK